ncbi:MAG: hypothetical protein ACK5Z5_07535 [Neisseriaceae bacterium]
MKLTDSCAGKGCWRKQMLYCNGMDNNIMLCHESEQTSNWCLIARDFIELIK